MVLSYGGPWSCCPLSHPRDCGDGGGGLESDARKQGSLSRELSDSWPI